MIQNEPKEKDLRTESTKKIEKMKFCIISNVYGILIHKTNLTYFLLDSQS